MKNWLFKLSEVRRDRLYPETSPGVPAPGGCQSPYGRATLQERGVEAERNLKASLREKELLLQEVHHRVKNNLQIISSLLNMQSRFVDNPLFASALQESQKRVWSMAMIHEMLYSSSSLADVDFGSYAQVLATEDSRSNRIKFLPGIDPARIRLALDFLEPLSFEMDVCPIPCGLILNELLSNAFKHAFSKWAHRRSTRLLAAAGERYIRLAV